MRTARRGDDLSAGGSFGPTPQSSIFAGAGDRDMTNRLRFTTGAVPAGTGRVAGAFLCLGAAV